MNDEKNDRLSVYEIGYLVASSVPEEKVPQEVESVKKIIAEAGSEVIADGNPELLQLAYTIRKKTVSGVYNKYDTAYFGWIKFEVSSDKIESIKNSIENHPSIIRMLLTTTVKENTYLGKRASSITSVTKKLEEGEIEDKKDVAPTASIEEMDKSIDAMVKEA